LDGFRNLQGRYGKNLFCFAGFRPDSAKPSKLAFALAAPQSVVLNYEERAFSSLHFHLCPSKEAERLHLWQRKVAVEQLIDVAKLVVIKLLPAAGNFDVYNLSHKKAVYLLIKIVKAECRDELVQSMLRRIQSSLIFSKSR